MGNFGTVSKPERTLVPKETPRREPERKPAPPPVKVPGKEKVPA